MLNPQKLEKELMCLSEWKQVVFLISICESVYPNFLAFSKENQYSGKEILRSSIDLAWQNVKISMITADLSVQQLKCEELAPDIEDFDTLLVSSALDAAVSVSLLMNYFSSHSVSTVVEAATLACDSVDMFVQDVENYDLSTPDSEALVLSHPLMQRELINQKETIEFLSNLNGDSASKPRIYHFLYLLSELVGC